MRSNVLFHLGRFFAGTGDAVATPSGDTRGHMRVYVGDSIQRGRSF